MKRLLLIALLLMCTAIFAATPVPNPQLLELQTRLHALDTDALQNNEAAMERLQARQALSVAELAKTRDRPDAIERATILLDMAELSVKIAQANVQLVQLDREHDAILVQASRRDAELARKESERLRLQVLAREEEDALALEARNSEQLALNSTETEQQIQRVSEARLKEIELALLEEELSAQVAFQGELIQRRVVKGKVHYLISVSVFEPATPTLNVPAKLSLKALAAKIKAGAGLWQIEAHTDSAGIEENNLLFSQKRAQALLNALKAAGVGAAKLKAMGMGSTKPVASNDSKAGRAQNRRIEIIQK